MTEQEPTSAWELAAQYNVLSDAQKKEFDFRRKEFSTVETAVESMEFVEKWMTHLTPPI